MNSWQQLRPRLRCPSGDDLTACATWLAFTLLGGLLPLWGTYFLTLIQNRHSSLYDYVGRAEFALYAAAAASAALFVVSRDLKAPFPCRSWMALVCIALLALSLLLFCGVFNSTPPDPANVPGSLNISFLAWSSIVVFIFAIIASAVVFLIDIQVAEYDPRRVAEQQISDLSKAVEKEQ